MSSMVVSELLAALTAMPKDAQVLIGNAGLVTRHPIAGIEIDLRAGAVVLLPAADGAELSARAADVLTWRRTGLLPEGELRALADRLASEGVEDSHQRAEDQTTLEALKLVAGAGAPLRTAASKGS